MIIKNQVSTFSTDRFTLKSTSIPMRIRRNINSLEQCVDSNTWLLFGGHAQLWQVRLSGAIEMTATSALNKLYKLYDSMQVNETIIAAMYDRLRHTYGNYP